MIDPNSLTPVQRIGDIWVKREDLFTVADVSGGKARACYLLMKEARVGVVTSGSRFSPQVGIVANIARSLELHCRFHTPTGEKTPEINDAISCGAEHIAHKAGYNSVIAARCRNDASRRGWTEIPFGMQCLQAVTSTAFQVRNLPEQIRRLVVPVGSGMTLAGILHGIQDLQRKDIKLLGVIVGADPVRRLDKWAPAQWRRNVQLIRCREPYHLPSVAALHGINLDPHYEAKCLPYIKPRDCFWIVGIRKVQNHCNG